MAQALIEKFRIYQNAFETAIQESDTADEYSGWTDIIRQDKNLLERVVYMVKNRNNDEGLKTAVLLCKHPKQSVQYIADKIMKKEKMVVEDRSTITL